MQIILSIVLAAIAILLFASKRYIPNDTLERAANVSGIVSLIAALMVLAFYTVPDTDKPSSTITPTYTLASTNTSFSTLLPYGDQILDIIFANEEGNCNDYDPKLLGYDVDKKLYYIIPSDNGYISVCHENDKLQPQGILQATASPDRDVGIYGYAVLFGWQGDGIITTDGCGFGVKKNNSTTEAFFVQRIRGEWEKASTILDDYSLDTKSHSIRMVLYPSGKAVGYLDGNYVAEHSFVDCITGPVGLIAYGPGGVRINFTSLKLFNLP